MFILVLLIALIVFLFAILLELEDNTLYKLNCINSTVLLTVLINFSIFFLIYYFPHYLLMALCGILITVRGFTYLGIFKIKFLSQINHLASHSFLIAIISSSSGFSLESALFILFGFYFLFFISAPIVNRFQANNAKSSEILKVLLEFNRVINGIFMFIIGLVIAANYIPFLEKLAEKIF